MGMHGALWYRAFLISSMIVLTLVAWFVVGGQAGAMVWVVGFLLLWATTRIANRLFAGFFLGDDRAPEFGQWPDEAPVPPAEKPPEDAGTPRV